MTDMDCSCSEKGSGVLLPVNQESPFGGNPGPSPECRGRPSISCTCWFTARPQNPLGLLQDSLFCLVPPTVSTVCVGQAGAQQQCRGDGQIHHRRPVLL